MLSEKQLEEPVVFFEKAWIDSKTDKLNVKYYLVRDLICLLSYPKSQTTNFNRVLEIDDEVEIKLYKEKGETVFLVKKNSSCYNAINLTIYDLIQSANCEDTQTGKQIYLKKIKELELCKKYLEDWFDEREYEFIDGRYYAREKAIVNKEPSEIESIPETVKPSESKLNDSEVQKITSEDQSLKQPSLSYKDAKRLLKKLETKGYDKRMSPAEKEIFNHTNFGVYLSNYLKKYKVNFGEIYSKLLSKEQIPLTEFYKLCNSPSSFYNEKLKNSMEQYCCHPKHNPSLDSRYILEFRQKNISPTEDKKELIEVMYLREKKK